MVALGAELAAVSAGTVQGGGAPGDGGMAAVILFYVFAAVTVGGAAGVAAFRDLRRSCVGLLLALVGVAGLYFLLHAEFLAAVELLAPVGGTLVMLMMGMVLTRDTPQVLRRARRGEIVWAMMVAGCVAIPLAALFVITPWQVRLSWEQAAGAEDIGMALVRGRGEGYLVVLEMTSVLLLAAMVGGAYLAKGRRPAAPSGPPQVETLAPAPAARARGRSRR